MYASHRVINKDDPKERFEFCNLPNCVFLSNRGVCSKLNITKCIGENCSFMKTGSDLKQSNEQCKKRLLSLDEEKQYAIAKKYYGGNMPWKENNNREE